MNTLSPGARRLPTHHITIRVPWHDRSWDGHVCDRPADNTSCLILPRISESRKDEEEVACAGQRFNALAEGNRPPCVSERVSFMAPFPLTRTTTHPYKEWAETHQHFAPARIVQDAYSAACVPFRWMLKDSVEGNAKEHDIGLAERLRLGYVPEREPDVRNRQGKQQDTNWIQERENQLCLLDTFFGAIQPEESLCFFYAKRTPMSEQARRVIVGVGRVLSVGAAIEHETTEAKSQLRSMVWERNVGHSIRPGFVDGFVVPYQELLSLANTTGDSPEDLVAFAPNEFFDQYSYASELLNHDGAVASLVACAATVHRIEKRVDGPWRNVLSWIDSQLNRLWQARGAYPGLGSALSAFGYEWGFQHGSLLAYEIDLLREQEGTADPWSLVDAVMENPDRLGGAMARLLKKSLRKGWKQMSGERRTLLQLLGRCAISEGQALRMYDRSKREKAGIQATDPQLLRNPYLLFELDRRSPDPIRHGAVDRGQFPDEAVRHVVSVSGPSAVDDPADPRRVRALVTDLLEEAADEGHSLLPQSWVIDRARHRALQPPCPLGEGVLAASEQAFEPVVVRAQTESGEVAYQADHLAACRGIIRREVRGRLRGVRHTADVNWREHVDNGLVGTHEDPEDEAQEELARQEKANALEQLYRSRLAVLIGPAGTGKTTLLRVLSSLPRVKDGGVLLLAPTGKARVRLEKQTGLRGHGQTLAQFLVRYGRYDGETGTYSPKRGAPKCGDYKTVIVDESSMLTEEQLAALIDSLSTVQRLVMVGDSRQLPPIGTGRPLVDIVRHLEPDDVESRFPRCAPGYAELTIERRLKGRSRPAVSFASHFTGRTLDPGADEVLEGGTRGTHRFIQWDDAGELHEKMIGEFVRNLKLSARDDEVGFGVSLGGERYKDLPRAFFWSQSNEKPGAAAKAEDWQALSPIRAGSFGVDALNRAIQARFRRATRALAEKEGWKRKVPVPFGPQGILYGDKVINVVNDHRKDIWPKTDGETFVANGDIGIVVGQYKTTKFKRLPWKLEVEFAGQSGHKYGFHKSEFGDEARNPLEVAYCLTVHKAQGSEFKTTFVILPNPCWLLSRELLYTALTRHTSRLIVFHQGPLADFRRFAHAKESAIARRMTNLFDDPNPCVVGVEDRPLFLEKGLIHRTERGELVRSKSEIVIADKLYSRGIDYTYERPLKIRGGGNRYPDFTIEDDAQGRTFYWEHLGRLHDSGYRARWERKRAEYAEHGIKPYQEGGGSGGVLIETRDDPSGGLDAAEIARLIDRVILGD